MVECQLPKLDVAGSIPVSRSIESPYGRFFLSSTAINQVQNPLDRVWMRL